MILRRAEVHEGDGDEEMMRVVSNGTRLRVPSHARSLALTHPPSQHSPEFLHFCRCHHPQSMDFQLCGFYTFGSHPPQALS